MSLLTPSDNIPDVVLHLKILSDSFNATPSSMDSLSTAVLARTGPLFIRVSPYTDTNYKKMFLEFNVYSLKIRIKFAY